jgi:dolichol-phosphate mannosyltransferase
VQLICVGILGEYVGRVYEEVKRRPLYIVRETAGLDDEGSPGNGGPRPAPPRARAGAEPAARGGSDN